MQPTQQRTDSFFGPSQPPYFPQQQQPLPPFFGLPTPSQNGAASSLLSPVQAMGQPYPLRSITVLTPITSSGEKAVILSNLHQINEITQQAIELLESTYHGEVKKAGYDRVIANAQRSLNGIPLVEDQQIQELRGNIQAQINNLQKNKTSQPIQEPTIGQLTTHATPLPSQKLAEICKTFAEGMKKIDSAPWNPDKAENCYKLATVMQPALNQISTQDRESQLLKEYLEAVIQQLKDVHSKHQNRKETIGSREQAEFKAHLKTLKQELQAKQATSTPSAITQADAKIEFTSLILNTATIMHSKSRAMKEMVECHNSSIEMQRSFCHQMVEEAREKYRIINSELLDFKQKSLLPKEMLIGIDASLRMLRKSIEDGEEALNKLDAHAAFLEKTKAALEMAQTRIIERRAELQELKEKLQTNPLLVEKTFRNLMLDICTVLSGTVNLIQASSKRNDFTASTKKEECLRAIEAARDEFDIIDWEISVFEQQNLIPEETLTRITAFRNAAVNTIEKMQRDLSPI